MSSATGIPEAIPDPALHPNEEPAGEDEPLLGRQGDASQPEGKALYTNLFIGTAGLAQGGILLLVVNVWANVFLSPVILFSAHPLLNSAGLLAVTQAILILQPTHTPTQKRHGTIAHFTLNNVALDALVAGLIIIEYNKFSSHLPHFHSVHAILGIITYVLLAGQAFVGVTAYFFPRIYGSVDKGKALYKYHRISGYVILVLLLATVAAATQTDYNKGVLGLKLWAVLLASILILAGVVPRIKKQKLGL